MTSLAFRLVHWNLEHENTKEKIAPCYIISRIRTYTQTFGVHFMFQSNNSTFLSYNPLKYLPQTDQHLLVVPMKCRYHPTDQKHHNVWAMVDRGKNFEKAFGWMVVHGSYLLVLSSVIAVCVMISLALFQAVGTWSVSRLLRSSGRWYWQSMATQVRARRECHEGSRDYVWFVYLFSFAVYSRKLPRSIWKMILTLSLNTYLLTRKR